MTSLPVALVSLPAYFGAGGQPRYILNANIPVVNIYLHDFPFIER
jgi:hypothetical protein